MFEDERLISEVTIRKSTGKNTGKKTSSRRVSKTLVELSIGIIGIIGIMLAQIANNPSHYELSIKVNLLNILF